PYRRLCYLYGRHWSAAGWWLALAWLLAYLMAWWLFSLSLDCWTVPCVTLSWLLYMRCCLLPSAPSLCRGLGRPCSALRTGPAAISMTPAWATCAAPDACWPSPHKRCNTPPAASRSRPRAGPTPRLFTTCSTTTRLPSRPLPLLTGNAHDSVPPDAT